MSEKSYRDAIREAMMEEMDRDPNVLIMGEDIGVYEGTFRITAGMLKKYGPKRVIDTPIAEAGMAGTAVGSGLGCHAAKTASWSSLRAPSVRVNTGHAGDGSGGGSGSCRR